MSRHDDALSLLQMCDYIGEAFTYDILWNIVSLDFPPLAEQLKAILPDT